LGDPDLIMEKIRHELGKGLPSKRKILSYLLDLLNKNKYPSLSDIEFYDIVGETYKINLEYKLNLKMLFDPIYNALKKKIKKLYGKEKKLEMEQYLIEKFGTNEPSFIIKNELQKANPFRSIIIDALNELRLYEEGSEYDPKDEWRYLPDTEFFNIVGEAFNIKPEFFMLELYQPFRNRLGKVLGKEKLKEMENYIIEKYCLYDGEQIHFECEGKIHQNKIVNYQATQGFSVNGWILFTTHRIIALGKAKGDSLHMSIFGSIIGDLIQRSIRNRKTKKEHLDSSIKQDLPCYGYQFPINSFGLQKKTSSVAYTFYIDNDLNFITITLPIWPSTSITGDRIAGEAIREGKLSKIFDILKKDPNQVLDFIKAELEWEIPSHKNIVSILYNLQKDEEYKDFTDADFYDVIRGTYKLNPKFFMDSVYRYLIRRLRRVFDKDKLMEFENFIKNLDIKVDA